MLHQRVATNELLAPPEGSNEGDRYLLAEMFHPERCNPCININQVLERSDHAWTLAQHYNDRYDTMGVTFNPVLPEQTQWFATLTNKGGVTFTAFGPTQQNAILAVLVQMMEFEPC